MNDSGKKMVRIDVTQADIDTGVPRNCSYCPITLAAERAFGGDPCGTTRCQLIVKDTTWVTDLPRDAIDFIWHFDMGHAGPLVPFSFEVEDPRPNVTH